MNKVFISMGRGSDDPNTWAFWFYTNAEEIHNYLHSGFGKKEAQWGGYTGTGTTGGTYICDYLLGVGGRREDIESIYSSIGVLSHKYLIDIEEFCRMCGVEIIQTDLPVSERGTEEFALHVRKILSSRQKESPPV